jgi:hypothetical protein
VHGNYKLKVSAVSFWIAESFFKQMFVHFKLVACVNVISAQIVTAWLFAIVCQWRYLELNLIASALTHRLLSWRHFLREVFL